MRSKIRTIRRIDFAMLPALALLAVLPAAALAEEGGAGHYGPGGIASFFDAFPPEPGGLALFGFYTHYQGDAEASTQIRIAGLTTFGLEATTDIATVGAFYRTRLNVLGGGLAVGVGVPIVWLDVRGTVSSRLGDLAKEDDASGIGDIVLYPLMLGWLRQGGDLRYDVRLGVYTPTGSYEEGKLANLGKNYWSFEPGVMVSYLGSRNGREASAYAAFDFNTKNQDTDYQTGTQFHVDATLAQHLPLLGGAAGVGANGFYYQQLADDSGEGALPIEFKGRTAGVGPVLSYVRKVGDRTVVSELKWLPELDTDKRLEGDFIWLKVALSL
jgi:hypothetical protein